MLNNSSAILQVLAHPWVTEDMPRGLGDLNDDILLSSPRTAARRGVMASLARRDAAFGTGPGQGGFSVGQTEVGPSLAAISSTLLVCTVCCRSAAQHCLDVLCTGCKHESTR